MRSAIKVIEAAKRKALASIESATANAKPPEYISAIEWDVKSYDQALAVLIWADGEQCKLAQAQANMDLVGR